MKSIILVFGFDFFSKIILACANLALIRFMPSEEYASYIFALSIVNLFFQAFTSAISRIYIVGYDALKMQNVSSFLGFLLICIGSIFCITVPLKQFMGNLYWLMLFIFAANTLIEFIKTLYQRELKFFKFAWIEFCDHFYFC